MESKRTQANNAMQNEVKFGGRKFSDSQSHSDWGRGRTSGTTITWKKGIRARRASVTEIHMHPKTGGGYKPGTMTHTNRYGTITTMTQSQMNASTKDLAHSYTGLKK